MRATAVTQTRNGHRPLKKNIVSNAAPTGIRTRNLSITSPALYQLSDQDCIVLNSIVLYCITIHTAEAGPGMGQYVATQATLTARDFVLADFCPSGPFICIFPGPLSSFSCVGCDCRWFLCGPAEYLPDAGSRVGCPRNINRLKNMTCGMMTCETNGLEIE